jgi:hypothetical protein
MLAASALLFASSPASALDLTVEVGLNGMIPSGGWTTVKARCHLPPGEPPLTGRVVLDRPSFAVSAYAAPVTLTPGKTTVVRLCVPIGMGKNYKVRVVDGSGRTLVEAGPKDPWQALEVRDRLCVLLGGKGLGALSGKEKDRPRLARVSPRDLPWDPRALEQVSTIFLPGDADADVVDLCNDARSVTLLRRYVSEGGRLVFLARPGVPPPWKGSLLEQLVPVQRAKLRSLDSQALVFMLGETPKGELTVLDAALRPGATWKHHDGSVGLVAQRTLGRGKVGFFAFDLDDPAVRDSEKLGKVLSSLAPHRSSFTFMLREKGAEELAREVFEARRPLGTLAFNLLLFAILLHVLALGPLASHVAKRRGPWRGLLVPPAASLIIGVVVLVAGALSRGDPEVRAVEFVFHDAERPGTGYAQLEAGLFAGSDTSFALELPSRWNPTLQERSGLDVLTFRAPGPALEFREGGVASLEPLVVPAGGFSQLRLRGAASGPRLRLRDVPDEPDQIELTSLESTRAIEGMFGLEFGVNGDVRIRPLAPLAAGASIRWGPGASELIDTLQPIGLDVFEVEPGLGADILARRIASLLLGEFMRSPVMGTGKKARRTFPRAWVVLIERGADPPFVARDQTGTLPVENLHHLRLHMIPVGEP